MASHAALDEQTARLIVRLQLEELREVRLRGAPEHNDFAIALALYENDLTAMNDHGMARRTSHAIRTDAQIIQEVLGEEQQASGDRRRALLETNGPATRILPMNMTAAAVTDDDGIEEDLLEEMCVVYTGDDELDNAYVEEDFDYDDSTPGHAATRPVVLKRQCIACGDAFLFYAVAHAPCGHDYCRGCLKQLFTLSLTDETLFPPRCCREPIPPEKYPLFLTPQLLGDFQARKVGIDTVDRTYCHVPRCNRFIPPQNIQHQIGRCVACYGRTCSICKAAAHVGDCPEDPATKVLDNIAAQNGWRRCNNCRRIVELVSGCNHITCHCGSEFCYLCGEKWRTCTCAVYTDYQLPRRREYVFAPS